jgi:2-phospho-L-lactate guanylyltransferase (CobY/MobA/RfbA family)
MARHAARARAAGATVKLRALPSLALDVDTLDDLQALRAALEARRELAPRTRDVLDRLVPAGAG